MASRVVVSVDDQALVDGLHALITRGSDLRPALEQIADDFLDMERRQFASRGAAGATPWAPLSAEWEARKQGGGILVGDTGRLARSLTQERARGGRRRIEVRPGRTSGLEVGSTHPLAHLHQGGTKERFVRSWRGAPLAAPRSAGKLPARPVVAVTPRDEQRWRGILAAYLFGEQQRALGL